MTKAVTFAVGTIVRLKSGGPEMTVQSLPSQHNAYYRCQWFAGKKLESGAFPPESLEVVIKAAE